MREIVLIDADNTLWNTNHVFNEAMMNMLMAMRNEGINIDLQKDLVTIQYIDDIYTGRYRIHEYDLRKLVLASLLVFKGLDVGEAIQIANQPTTIEIEENLKIAKRCYSSLYESLKRIPPLYEDTKAALLFLQRRGDVVILISESNEGKLYRIIHHYHLEVFFDCIFGNITNLSDFRRAYLKGMKLFYKKYTHDCNKKTIVIGDSLEKEIFFGNMIGAITFYKPGDYKPHQKPRNEMETPDYIVKHFPDIQKIITKCIKD